MKYTLRRDKTKREKLAAFLANRRWLVASVAGAPLLALGAYNLTDAPDAQDGLSSVDAASLQLRLPSVDRTEVCPETMSPIIPKPDPFPFPVDPAAQQKLLQDLEFDIGRHKPDGVFKERTITSINEVRNLYYGSKRRNGVPFAETLTEGEYRDLSAFAEQVKRDARTYDVPVGRMANVSFAARAFGMRVDELLPMTDQGQSGFRGSTTDFLYLMKKYGARFGMGAFANQIKMEGGWLGGAVSLRVDDPVAFMMIEQLRQYDRTAILFEARRLAEGNDMPRTQEWQNSAPAGDLAQIKADLATIGADVLIGGADEQGYGIRTEAALNLYRKLYTPLVPKGANVDDYLPRFAALAMREKETYEALSRQVVAEGRAGKELSIPTQTIAGIRLANLRTGADFEYLMKLAYAESTFDYMAGAKTSTAIGPYQFIENTFGEEQAKHGAQFAMGFSAKYVEVKPDMNGLNVARTEVPWMRISSLPLRVQPLLASSLSASFQLDNKFKMECVLQRPLQHAEWYMGHFMGPDQGTRLLQFRDDAPNTTVAVHFATQAKANQGVFYDRSGNARTANGIVEGVFAKKFDLYPYPDMRENILAVLEGNYIERDRALREQQLARQTGGVLTREGVRALGVTKVERKGDLITVHHRSRDTTPPRAPS